MLAIRYDWRNNSVVVVHNLGATPREVWLKLDTEGLVASRTCYQEKIANRMQLVSIVYSWSLMAIDGSGSEVSTIF